MKRKILLTAQVASAIAATVIAVSGPSAFAATIDPFSPSTDLTGGSGVPNANPTGGGVTPATSTILSSAPASGTPYFTYNSSTGDVQFVVNGLADSTPHYLSDIGVESAGGNILDANYAFASQEGATTGDPQFVDWPRTSPGYNDTGSGTIDLGDILNTGLTNSELASDLTLGWNQGTDNGTLTTTDTDDNGFEKAFQAEMVVAAVPEPASLGLLGIGALGLLGGRHLRRRRRGLAAS